MGRRRGSRPRVHQSQNMKKNARTGMRKGQLVRRERREGEKEEGSPTTPLSKATATVRPSWMPRELVVRTSTPVPLISAVALRAVLREAPVKTLARTVEAPAGKTM